MQLACRSASLAPAAPNSSLDEKIARRRQTIDALPQSANSASMLASLRPASSTVVPVVTLIPDYLPYNRYTNCRPKL
jgi:hypothetical protein